MTIVNANRVRENTTGNGTGALALLGAVTNFQTFLSGVGSGNQCYYAITHQSKNEWEVGLGTFTLSAGIPYLSRNTVYNSSNGNLLVDFTSGTKQCAVIFPGTQIDTIASNVGVAAGYANDANTYAALASTAAVNANLYRVSAAAEASLAGTYAAAASVSYVDAASAAAQAASLAAQVSSVATEASLALVAASLAQIYKTSASAYATEAGGYASVAQIYKVSASAFATDAANQASIAGVYKASASAFATSAAADASAAAVSRAQASAFATNANDSASAALVYRNSAVAAASAAAVDASLAAIYRTSANNAASAANNYAAQASSSNVSAAANASMAAIYAASASVAAVSANNAASIAGVYAASASAFASAASRDASLAFIYKTSASAFAASAGADASLALIYRTSASAYATQAADSASLAAYYAGLVNPSAYALLSSTNTFTGANTFTSLVNIRGATSLASTLVVAATTASDAVRITQTGTGNALVVEDSANPDATPFVIDSVGVVINGATTPKSSRISTTSITPGMQQVGGTNNSSNIGIFGFASNPGLLIAKSNGTEAAPTAVVSGNTIARISGAGFDGTNYTEAGSIRIEVDGTPGTDDMPGRLVFSTTPDGSWIPNERMRIDSSGNVGIGTNSPTASLHVNGSFLTSGVATFTSAVDIKGATSLASTLVVGGAATFNSNVSVSGVMVVGAGTTSAPSYSTTGDTNTGLYFPAADTIAVATSGTERMRIDNAGNVGIGTASPGQKLTVAGTVESTSGGFKFPDGTTQSSAASGGVLTGTILDYGGITAPSGYLFCDGSAVSRTTYATLWATLNASSTVTITIASPGVVTWNAHPLSNGDGIRLQTTGALPTGLTANTTYYVINKATNTFQLSTSRGGTAINTSGTQSGTHTAIFAPWGFGDNSTTFNVPDLRGRAGVGRDDMGGTAASRITTAGSGISGVSLGDAGGTQTHTLTTAQMPAHSHDGVVVAGGVGAFEGLFQTGGSTGTTGGGGAHQNTQPSAIVNKIIKT